MDKDPTALLYDAAIAWNALANYCYVFTYGYKKKLHTIRLMFPPERFRHIAGFQYLKDISIPRYNPSKTLDMILSGKIPSSKIEKSIYYEDSIKPRLQAIIRLKQTIEDDFSFYSFMPLFYSFPTRIQADYLISSASEPVDFIFIIKANSHGSVEICDFVCCSAFTQTNRDFRENQRPRVILKKERLYLPTGQSTVLYDKLSLQLQEASCPI